MALKIYDSLRLIRACPRVKPPHVSFALRSKNEERDIKYCLESIISQVGDLPYEIILLDSGSTDQTLEIAKLYPVDIYAISSEEFSFGDSCNLIVELCKGDVIFMMSAHVEFISDNAVAEAYSYISACKMTCGYFRQIPNLRSGYNAYEMAFLRKTFPKTGRHKMNDPKGFSNAAAVYRRMDLSRLPFPDVVASEDYLWAKEFISIGGTVKYFNNLSVAHSHNESSSSVRRRVHINAVARLGGADRSIFRAFYYFIGVFFCTLVCGGTIRQSFMYANSHMKGYYCKY